MAEHGEKVCTACRRTLPLSEFGTYVRKNRGGRVYVYTYCRPCKNARHDPLRARKNVLLNKYKLTWEDFCAMFDAQGQRCAVCTADSPGGPGHWHIDHDHSCCPGKKSCGRCVRGVLCHLCNTALGCARDSTEVLTQMIDYLARTGVNAHG